MNAENYWQQFTLSGKIEDYLTYSRKIGQEKMSESAGKQQKGVDPYAGFDYRNGNDFKSDAYR